MFLNFSPAAAKAGHAYQLLALLAIRCPLSDVKCFVLEAKANNKILMNILNN